MSTATLSKTHPFPANATLAGGADDVPLTVRQAATYLGVSVQTVYLWVERKQIPHLRVMGRNIRFLKSDLEPLRNIQAGGGNWHDRVNTMVSYIVVKTATFGRCATGMRPVAAARNRQIPKTGTRRSAGCVTVSMPATIALWRSCEGANNSRFKPGRTRS